MALVGVIAVVAVGVWALRGNSDHGAAVASVASRSAVRADQASARLASQRLAPAPSDAGTESPATEEAYRLSLSAAMTAAVHYPGALALDPKTPSVGGLPLRPRHKYVAITFDDGYNFQLPMLALLEKYHVRATTFLIGSWVRDNVNIVRRLNADGFEIANHTWSHPNLSALSSDRIARELTRTQAALTRITGTQAPYMRPPGGATNPKVKAAAARLGYRIVLWDRTFGESRAYYWVMQFNGGVHPGDVILCHWGDADAYNAMQRILPELRAKGYEFVTLSELIADSAGR